MSTCHICHETAVRPVRVRCVVNDEARGYQGHHDEEDETVTMCAACYREARCGQSSARHEPVMLYSLEAAQ